MKTSLKIRKVILSILAISLAVFSLLVLGTGFFDTPNRFDIVQLESGWTISRGDTSWVLPSITSSNIGSANKGDVIELTRTLPQVSADPATLHYKTVLSATEVLLEDRVIYSYGEDVIEAGGMPTKMEHFIQLPSGYAGKELTIRIISGENNAFSGLSPINFGNYNDIKNSLIQQNRPSMIIGVYLCHLGFMLLVIAPFLAFSRNHDFSIFFGAATSVLMGVYILCYNDIFWYISDNPEFYNFVEYFSLFMFPAAIMGFILTSGQASFKVLGIVLFFLNVAFALITSFLHLTNFMHICYFVPFLHIIAVSEGIFVIISLILAAIRQTMDNSNRKTRITSINILIGGLVFFVFCSVIDIIKFNIMKYTEHGEINAHISFMTFGALVFIMSLLLHYFYHYIEYFNDSTAKVQLEGLAYTDSLTNLANRAKCEQTLTELTGSFTIISLDLDYLKYTNDNYGHDQGDKLLAGFADIMHNCFTDATLVGRMGGDEFIAVLPYVDDERTCRDLDCLSDQLAYRNKTESRLRYSASWGFASSNDPELSGEKNAHSVYLLADKRMYTMKSSHHNQSMGRLYDDLMNKILGEGGKL